MSELSKTRVREAVALRDTLIALKTRVPYTEADRAELVEPDAQKLSLHNKWSYQMTFSTIIADFSDEMLAMVKNAPKMGTAEFLAMFPYDGAKRLYDEIEDNVRTDLQGSIGVQHDQETQALESDLADLRDKLADTAKNLKQEQAKSAGLWDSLRQAQDRVLPESGSRIEHVDKSVAEQLVNRSMQLRDISMQLCDISRHYAPVTGKGKGKEAMSPTGKVEPTLPDNGGKRKKPGVEVIPGASSSGIARKGTLVKTLTIELGKYQWGVRKDLLLTDMNYPNKGDVRNTDILEAVKQQLGRNLSAAELRVITHHNGPLLKVKSAVYVGSAVSKTCRNDTDWYLQFHTFFLRFFQTLRKAYDDVSTEYEMAVADGRNAFKADMMARFEDDIYGPAKAPMAKKLFELVAQHPGTGVNVTMIKRSLTNHWDAKPGKWLTYDVELLGKETPLVLTAGASSGAGGAKKAGVANSAKKAKVLASKALDDSAFPAELAEALVGIEPTEGDKAGEEADEAGEEADAGQGSPISRLGSDTSLVFTPEGCVTPDDYQQDGDRKADSSSDEESDSSE